LAWLFILIAATFEAAWTFSLKLMSFDALKTLKLVSFYKPDGGLFIILPFVGYILFGIGNIYFFTLAIKELPMATSYAVWTAVTLILIKIAEVSFFHQKISALELLFITMIMAGILGLKFCAPQIK
jgi:quaternary ammonium compound-resistance protein SugE